MGLNNLEGPTKKNIYLLPAFLIPAAILVFTFVVIGIYPFGKLNIIDHDLYHQYLPIMEEFQRVLHGEGSLFYSFKGGLGTNFYALSTYQNASPITWLFLLIFKESQLVLCVTLMIMLKICLASCTMYYYLSKAGGGQNQLIHLALSSAYALCGYVIAYYHNVMWLETIILLPIVVLGMRRAMAGEGNKLYVIALVLMLMTCYYTGLMMCIFLFMYFFVHYFADGGKEFVKTLVRIGVLSAIGITISMIVLLPTVLALTKTSNYAALGEGLSNFFYYSIPTHFSRLLPGSKVTALSGPANLYTCLATLILLFLFIFNSAFPKRKRVIKGLFILFLFASTNIFPLDFVWHLLHVPNDIPARYSFLLAFMLVEVAGESLEHIDDLKRKHFLCAFLCIIALYAVALPGIGGHSEDKRFMLLLGIVLIALYAFVFFVARETSSKMATALLTIVIILEVSLSTFHGIGDGGLMQKNSYHLHKSQVSEFIEMAEKEDPFARLEIPETDNGNAPYVYGYKGASIFASSVPYSNYLALGELLKSKTRSINKFRYGNVDTSRDSLLNIRYYISLDGKLETPGLKLISQIGDCYLYENPLSTGMGFMLPPNTNNLSLIKPEDVADIFKVEGMEGREVTGSINVSSAGTCIMTIPYDDSWHVKVDGKNAGAIAERNGLISFTLKKGAHKIEMKYTPAGFYAGLTASVIGVILFAAYEVLARRKKIS